MTILLVNQNSTTLIQAGKKTEETLSCKNPANISNKFY